MLCFVQIKKGMKTAVTIEFKDAKTSFKLKRTK